MKGRDQSSREIKQAEKALKTHTTKSLLATEATITAHVTAQATETIGLITQNAHKLNLQAVDSGRRERVLGSLKFPSMNERWNQLTDSHEDTFKWVFDSLLERNDASNPGSESKDSPNGIGQHRDRPWDSFSDWLKSDSKMFWISGKPGSGKSTLVKYIVSALPTITDLNLWRSECRILYHFFWKPGLMIQRSIKGMLCSLLYQIFISDSAVIDANLMRFDWLATKDVDTDWSPKELQLLLLTVLSTQDVSFCIFIDGLDEICQEDGAGALLKLVADLKAIPNVKLCLASRPEPRFRRQLSIEPHLTLEDLTASDMESYTRSMLEPYLVIGRMHLMRYIVHDLVDKAEGVFLWLRLAIRSLVDGLENGDSEDELIERLDGFPRELSRLYYDMWTRLNENVNIYQKSAAKYFNLLIGAVFINDQITERTPISLIDSPLEGGGSVFQLVAAADPNVQTALLSLKLGMSEQDLDTACSKLRNDILVRCAGLVEIRKTSETSPGNLRPFFWKSSDGMLESHISSRVTFVHRTAYDFLIEDEEGCRIRQYDLSSLDEQVIQIVKGELAASRMYRLRGHNSVFGVLLALSTIEIPKFTEEINQLLQLCWEWYDEGYLAPDERDIHHAKPHFLAVASLPPFSNFVVSRIEESLQPSVLATEILRDLLIHKPSCEIPEILQCFLKPLLSINGNINTTGVCSAPYPGISPTNAVPFSTAFAQFLQGLVYQLSQFGSIGTLEMDILSTCLETEPDLTQRIPITYTCYFKTPETQNNPQYRLYVDRRIADEVFPSKGILHLTIDGNAAFWIKALLRAAATSRAYEPRKSMHARDTVAPHARVAIILQSDPKTGPRCYRPLEGDLIGRFMTLFEAWLDGSEARSTVADTVEDIAEEIRNGSHLYEYAPGSINESLARDRCGYRFIDEDGNVIE